VRGRGVLGAGRTLHLMAGGTPRCHDLQCARCRICLVSCGSRARGVPRLALTVLQWRGYQGGSRSHAAAAARMRSRLGCRLRLAVKRAHQGQGPASQPNTRRGPWETSPARHRASNATWSPGYPAQDLTTWPTTSTGLVIRRGHDDSAFFDRELWLSSPSQATSCRKIRYSSRIATTGDHA
jgi:hypothetical protein